MIGKLTKNQRNCLLDAAVQPLLVIEAGNEGEPVKARSTKTIYGRSTLHSLLSRNWLEVDKDFTLAVRRMVSCNCHRKMPVS